MRCEIAAGSMEAGTASQKLRYLFGFKRIRYLDKTITNCFHLRFLNRAFPDAQYIMLLRDAGQTLVA
jgi:hypothetical protein